MDDELVTQHPELFADYGRRLSAFEQAGSNPSVILDRIVDVTEITSRLTVMPARAANLTRRTVSTATSAATAHAIHLHGASLAREHGFVDRLKDVAAHLDSFLTPIRTLIDGVTGGERADATDQEDQPLIPYSE